MTNQEKKEYLQKYGILGLQLEHEINELDYWKSLSQNICRVRDHDPPSHLDGDPLQVAVEKIEELSEVVHSSTQKLINMREKIETCIKSLGDEKMQAILRYHYLDGIDLNEVAQKMHYCYRQITRKHRQALERIDIN